MFARLPSRLLQRQYLAVGGSTGNAIRSFSSCDRNHSNNAATTKLIVVRHGQTEWNRRHLVQGASDIPLNDTGRHQARQSAERIRQHYLPLHASTTPIRVCSSPSSRANETATIVAQRLDRAVATPVETHEDVAEWNLGAMEGLHKDEAASRYPTCWSVLCEWTNPFLEIVDDTVRDDNITHRHMEGGGESMEEVRQRAVAQLEALATTDVVICVTHGGVIGQLLRHTVQTGGVSQNQLEELRGAVPRPTNGSIAQFTIRTKMVDDENNEAGLARRSEWELDAWADCAHLDDEAKD